jgi:prepilin-type N-terminal cleavage/methylation domain-containing protein/prepilin-type processing-associated H-X9-DG protein
MSTVTNSDRTSRTHRRGFTLVELLVVVTIIVLLLAMMMPSLGKAMSLATRTACASNLHQIGLSLVMYAGQNRRYIPEPIGPGNVRNGKTLGDWSWWWYPEWLAGYITDRKVYLCPNDLGWAGGGFNKPISDPGYPYDSNSYPLNTVNFNGLAQDDDLSNRSLFTTRRPSQTLMVLDWGGYPGFSWHDPQPASQYDNALNNVCFVDGHVSYIPFYWPGTGWSYSYAPINDSYTWDPTK